MPNRLNARERKIRKKLKESLKKEDGKLIDEGYNFRIGDFTWGIVNLDGKISYMTDNVNGYTQKEFFISGWLLDMLFDFYEKNARDTFYYKKKSRSRKLKKIIR